MSKHKTKNQTGPVTEPTKTPATNTNTVNGKRKLYHQTAINFQEAANEMRIEGINNLLTGVCEMQKSIHQTAINFQEAAKKMHADGTRNLQSGVAEMVSGIAAMQVSIADQVKQHQEYTKQFYG